MPRKPAPKVEKYEGARVTTYRVRVRHNGQQTTETFDSFAAAQAFATTVREDGVEAAIAERQREDRNSSAYVPTLAEMLKTHVSELTGVDQRTRDDYLSVARRSWLPMLGKIRVGDITKADVGRWVNHQDGKSAPKTIKNAHSVLHAVLETAVDAGHLPSNPAHKTRLPRTGENELEAIRFLQHSEFDRLIEHVPDHYLPLVVTLFGTGVRWSEATALQVQDVNLETGTLRVMRAWKRGSPPRLGPPKSKKSRRVIWIGAEVQDVLAPLLDRPGNEFLFTTTRGNVVRHGNFRERVWVTACDAAGLAPRPRIHDARHSHASWLIAEGVRLEVIQDRLGHDNYEITRKVYGHLMPAMQREAGMAASVAFASTSLGSRLRAIEGSDVERHPALGSHAAG